MSYAPTEPAAEGGLRGRIKDAAARLAARTGLGPRLRQARERAMDAVLQLTRVTNDGAYRSVRDAQKVSEQEPPPEPGRRRGLPGG